MRQRFHLIKGVLAALCVVALAGSAAAQTGRVGGVVKDEAGNPIKGATVTAENPAASPSSFTATTDDKGRFSIIGLKAGGWSFAAQAPGFGPESGKLNVSTIGAPNPPLTFTMKKGGGAGPSSALGSMAAKDLQADLATADALYNAQKYDEAIVSYRAIMAKAPALSVINLQIAAAYRNKKDYDSAAAVYNDLLKADPGSDKARIGLALTYMEKGDLPAAETALSAAAQTQGASKEVLYSLGEIEAARGKTADATSWYQKASASDPNWGKPLLKLGLTALQNGDRANAAAMMQRVVAVDPTSAEATQAKTVIEQLR